MSEAANRDFGSIHDDVIADIHRSTLDAAWLSQHREELRKSHPNMFVAVYDRKVVSVADAIEDMKAKLRAQGISPEKCVTEILLAEDYIWVL